MGSLHAVFPQLMREAVMSNTPQETPQPSWGENPVIQQLAMNMLAPKPEPMPTDLRTVDLRGASMLSSQNMRALMEHTQQVAQAELAGRQLGVEMRNRQITQSAEQQRLKEQAIQQAINNKEQLGMQRQEMIYRAITEEKRGKREDAKDDRARTAAEAAALIDGKRLGLEERRVQVLEKNADKPDSGGGGGGGVGGQPRPITAAVLGQLDDLYKLNAEQTANRLYPKDTVEWMNTFQNKYAENTTRGLTSPNGTIFVPQNTDIAGTQNGDNNGPGFFKNIDKHVLNSTDPDIVSKRVLPSRKVIGQKEEEIAMRAGVVAQQQYASKNFVPPDDPRAQLAGKNAYSDALRMITGGQEKVVDLGVKDNFGPVKKENK